MNCLIIITLFICCALALPNVQEKEGRKAHPGPCVGCDCRSDYEHSGPSDCDDCDDPCDDCEEPRVHTKEVSPITVQQVTDRTILVCSKDSYFDRIEYDACYEWNTTCNGVIVTSDRNTKGIYTGIIVDPRTGKETTEQLNAKQIKWITTHNFGNEQTWEEAQLDDCECNGDILRAQSNWVSPVSGLPNTRCCDEGGNHVQAKAYKLEIFGKCCSECFLLQGSLSWQKLIKN